MAPGRRAALEAAPPEATRGPRDRILDAAGELFAAYGVRAVGVDAIIASASVAKGSFYRHFPSKDDLVDAWLRTDKTRWLSRVVADTKSRTTDPAEQLLAFYDALATFMSEPDFAGCAYLNIAAELRDPGTTALPVVTDFVLEVREHFRSTAEAAGVRDPESIANKLQLLTAGALTTALVMRNATSAGVAKGLAALLLEDHRPD